jgi:hypothetical protein
MSDYSKSVIYKLYCDDKNEIYIGSTHDEKERKRDHKSKCNNENSDGYNYKVYIFIRANGGMDTWKFEVIQEFPCDNDIQLRIRERYYYDLLNPLLNSQRPFITEEELKEEQRIYMKKYNFDNREELNKRHNQKYTCECGIEYSYRHKARHCDSKKHKKFILNKHIKK